MVRKVRLDDLFNDEELELALTLWRGGRECFHEQVQVQVVDLALPRINAETGQENDAAYLAYVLEHALCLAAMN
jgi:hypothetical protein